MMILAPVEESWPGPLLRAAYSWHQNHVYNPTAEHLSGAMNISDESRFEPKRCDISEWLH
jgi:hypothetical protein